MLRLAIANEETKQNDVKFSGLEKTKHVANFKDESDESDEPNDNVKVKINDLSSESTDASHLKSEVEKNLESLVFGAEASMLANIDRFNKKKAKKKKLKKEENLIVDGSGGADDDINNNKKHEASSVGKKKPIASYFEERKPAWNDPDDNELLEFLFYC
jgi:hypothetical protein